MPRPIVALLTDFGTRDHYVAAMKGVVLGICADATLVDITHDIPPQDILAGALELRACAWTFPLNTVFLVVVDPGVGTSRRAIAVRAGERFFVGPDNGVLEPAVRSLGAAAIVELTNRRFARPEISRTFEGRDRFAPAAAWLATGTPLTELGSSLATLERLPLPEPRVTSDLVEGEVVSVDRFGNLVTNIQRRHLIWAGRRPGRVTAGSREVPLADTYGAVGRGELLALFGSSDALEVAVSGGSAAALLGAGRGLGVRVLMVPVGR